MWQAWCRTCAYCKVSWGEIDFLCEQCWSELEKRLRPTHKIFSKNKLTVFTLWQWEKKDVRLQKLLLDLKGRNLPEARERMLLLFLDFLKYHLPPQTICCVISRDSRDHGLAMAESFAQQYQCPLVPLKLYKMSTHYKTLHRRQRYTERKVLLDPSMKQRVKEPVWFVDDVLTTGATAEAVWEALGRPLEYRAVTMVYRAFE